MIITAAQPWRPQEGPAVRRGNGATGGAKSTTSSLRVRCFLVTVNSDKSLWTYASSNLIRQRSWNRKGDVWSFMIWIVMYLRKLCGLSVYQGSEESKQWGSQWLFLDERNSGQTGPHSVFSVSAINVNINCFSNTVQLQSHHSHEFNMLC